MDANDALIDGFGRVKDELRDLVEGLGTDDLARQPFEGSNSIGWILWHIARVVDASISGLAGDEQLYVSDGWAERMGFEVDPSDSGYGHTVEQAAAVRIRDVDAALAYLDASVDMAIDRLRSRQPADYDKVIDERWDPPVTEGVRWVSVLGDCLEHIGQVGYARGQLAL